MTTAIRAIPTTYRGYRFRSRLEARWAVFFEEMGVPWVYENEGVDLGTVGPPGDQFRYGWYLPDFELASSVFVEIKPAFDVPLWRTDVGRYTATGISEALLFLPRLAELSGRDSILIAGNPWPGEYRAFVFSDDEPFNDGPLIGEFADCRKCDGLCVANDNVGGTTIICRCEPWRDSKIPIVHGTNVMKAFHASRTHEFWKPCPSR